MIGETSGILSYSFITFGSACQNFQQGLKKDTYSSLNRCFHKFSDWETPNWRNQMYLFFMSIIYYVIDNIIYSKNERKEIEWIISSYTNYNYF